MRTTNLLQLKRFEGHYGGRLLKLSRLRLLVINGWHRYTLTVCNLVLLATVIAELTVGTLDTNGHLGGAFSYTATWLHADQFTRVNKTCLLLVLVCGPRCNAVLRLWWCSLCLDRYSGMIQHLERLALQWLVATLLCFAVCYGYRTWWYFKLNRYLLCTRLARLGLVDCVRSRCWRQRNVWQCFRALSNNSRASLRPYRMCMLNFIRFQIVFVKFGLALYLEKLQLLRLCLRVRLRLAVNLTCWLNQHHLLQVLGIVSDCFSA